jgi:Med18 protein
MSSTSQIFLDKSSTRKLDTFQLPSLTYRLPSYSSEHIREAYYAYRENVTFCLSRVLQRPKQTDGGLASDLSHVTQGTLPAFEEFQPFDAENKWALTISVLISDGSQPALMQRGLDQLAQVKHDLAGIVEFSMTPRHRLDTRVQSYNQSMRA